MEITQKAVSVLQLIDDANSHEKIKRSIIAKAHKEEQQRMKEGWKYINVTPSFRLFVPCDQKGRPTKEAIAKIEKKKKSLGIM